MNTDAIGDRSTGRVLAALLEKFKNVSVPFGVARYDLIVEHENGSLHKVQCKTGRLRDGVIIFNAYSITGRNSIGYGIKRYDNDVDFFGVYCPQTSAVYLIPVSEIRTSKPQLRVIPAKNNQVSGVKMASEFQISP